MKIIKTFAFITLLIFLGFTFTSFMPIEICNIICTLCVSSLMFCFAKEYYDNENKTIAIVLAVVGLGTIISIFM